MATCKVFGLYSGLPTYGMQSFFMWICFGLPFIPIFKFSSYENNHVHPMLGVIYFVLYLIQTFILGRYIAKIGRQWTQKEYDKLKSDQITFPFIFALGMHALFHFVLFVAINKMVNTVIS